MLLSPRGGASGASLGDGKVVRRDVGCCALLYHELGGKVKTRLAEAVSKRAY